MLRILFFNIYYYWDWRLFDLNEYKLRIIKVVKIEVIILKKYEFRYVL